MSRTMALQSFFAQTSLGKHYNSIREASTQTLCNHNLLLSAFIYATAAIPATWDQGSASVVPSLPGFQKKFGISSGTDAQAIRNFVTIVYIGYAAGSALSFFVNDRIGRRQAFRLYTAVWAAGQLVATLSPGLAGLDASRIITGVGIGGLTVTGPVSIVEIAPAEIRGLLTSWYGVCMGLALFCSIFCVYGMYLHVPAGPLQYQVVFFAPCVFMLVSVAASFWICESPRWLVMMGRHEDAVVALTRLRGLPVSHPRLESEIIYAMGYGTPSLLETTGDWGAFIFFACWCFVALCYVYFMVPEIAGMSVEEVDNVFKTSWFTAYKRPERPLVVEGLKDVNVGRVDTSDGKQSHQYSP